MPATCWALSARSSASTPAVFRAATLVTALRRQASGDIVEQGERLDGMGAPADYPPAWKALAQ
jgi:hypothetical protein